MNLSARDMSSAFRYPPYDLMIGNGNESTGNLLWNEGIAKGMLRTNECQAWVESGWSFPMIDLFYSQYGT